MTETEKHKKLKLLGRVLLKDKGFLNTEIHEEYKILIGRKNYVVDICGINPGLESGQFRSSSKGKAIAVECGTSDSEKLINLGLFFDEIIYLPYGITSLDTDLRKTLQEEMEKRTSLKKEIERLEKRITALNRYISTLNNRVKQNKNLEIIAEALKRHATRHYYSYSKDDKKIMAIMSILEGDLAPDLTGTPVTSPRLEEEK